MRDRVDELTLSVWVPSLYPTASQRVLKTMEEADRQAQENLKAAKRVAEFAERLEGDLADFKPNIARANAMLEEYAVALSLAKKTAESFTGATEEISGFRGDLQEAYRQIGKQADRTHELAGALAAQNGQLLEGVRVLRVFEDTYVKQQEALNGESLKLLQDVRAAVKAVSVRNEEVIRAVGEPIVERLIAIDASLQERLSALDVTLHDRLKAVREGLSILEDPVKGSVDRVAGIAASFDASTTRLLGELKREFDRQNGQSEGETAAMRELAKGLRELLTELQASGRRQDQLAGDVHALAKAASKRQNGHAPPGWLQRIYGRFY